MYDAFMLNQGLDQPVKISLSVMKQQIVAIFNPQPINSFDALATIFGPDATLKLC